jgi:5-oxoprolinase (ATP-hydrolysing) subunit A
MKYIDLNCDMGEMPEMLADGSQEALMQYVSSANVACGGHAGDAGFMRRTIEQALHAKVAIGAHPSYEDRANFGRLALNLSVEEIAAAVHRQVAALDAVAKQCRAEVLHVKPHGALYNQAARNAEIARAIAEGVSRWRKDVVLIGLAGSVMLDEFGSAGFRVAAEAFADRRYEADGSLRSRKFEDALLCEPELAATQALRIVEEGSAVAADGCVVPLRAQTMCLHGDTPGAVEIASAVYRRLAAAGVGVRSLGSGK